MSMFREKRINKTVSIEFLLKYIFIFNSPIMVATLKYMCKNNLNKLNSEHITTQ